MLVEWESLDAHFEEGILEAIKVESSVAARKSFGGTAPERARKQLERAKGLVN